MKKIIVSIFILIFILSLVSACGWECPEGKTLVKGKIYEEATGKKIKNAEVKVICHGEDGDVSENTQSKSSGKYVVLFSQEDCDYGDSVTVEAGGNGLTGTSTGIIDKHIGKHCLDLDIGIIHVPLVPEFGLIVGALTLLSAVGLFFVIRRE